MTLLTTSRTKPIVTITFAASGGKLGQTPWDRDHHARKRSGPRSNFGDNIVR